MLLEKGSDQLLWHYIQSIPLFKTSWSEPFSRHTLYLCLSIWKHLTRALLTRPLFIIFQIKIPRFACFVRYKCIYKYIVLSMVQTSCFLIICAHRFLWLRKNNKSTEYRIRIRSLIFRSLAICSMYVHIVLSWYVLYVYVSMQASKFQSYKTYSYLFWCDTNLWLIRFKDPVSPLPTFVSSASVNPKTSPFPYSYIQKYYLCG